MFLFPFHCSSPIWTSAAIPPTSSTLPDSDVTPEVDSLSVQKLDCVNSIRVDSQTSGAGPDGSSSDEVDVMTSRPNSVADDDDDDDDKRHRCHDDVTATSSVVTSPSKELKFGIDRILIKNNDVKDSSPIGIAIDSYFLLISNVIGFNSYFCYLRQSDQSGLSAIRSFYHLNC